MRIKSKITGEIIEVDNHDAREARLKKRVRAWAECVQGKKELIIIEVCLTYIRGADWRPGHIKKFMHKIKWKYRETLKAYAWVAENQERGAIHYHIELIMTKGARIQFPDNAGDWGHGCTSVKEKRSFWYIVTHLGKERQSYGLPGGARRFAVWTGDLGDETDRRIFKLSAVPGWVKDIILKENLGENVKIERAPGGGWLLNEKLYKSEWECIK